MSCTEHIEDMWLCNARRNERYIVRSYVRTTHDENEKLGINYCACECDAESIVFVVRMRVAMMRLDVESNGRHVCMEHMVLDVGVRRLPFGIIFFIVLKCDFDIYAIKQKMLIRFSCSEWTDFHSGTFTRCAALPCTARLPRSRRCWWWNGWAPLWKMQQMMYRFWFG